MASEYFVDENGNIVKVSGTINNAEMLPIESGSATDTKSYIDGYIKAWTYNGQRTINDISGSATWDLINAIPNDTKELLIAICVGPNHRIMRWCLVIPFDVFGDYGCFPDFTLGTERLYCTLTKTTNSQFSISGVSVGGITSDITLNCYYR